MNGIWQMSVTATAHCLTGCAIGEVLGIVIGTAVGLPNAGTIALAIVLAFFFGYALTFRSGLRSGLMVAAAVRLALAADTVSIAVMELVDNAVIVAVPGAMDAGLTSALFWGALVVSLAVAFVVALPVNRFMIGRGIGHAAVHRLHTAGHAGGQTHRPQGYERHDHERHDHRQEGHDYEQHDHERHDHEPEQQKQERQGHEGHGHPGGRSLTVVTESPSPTHSFAPPARTPLRRLTPPDPPMVPIAVAGTVTWLVLGLVLLAIRPTLAAGGNENWATICFTGALLGVVGIAIMALHDRNRRRRAGAAE